MKHSLKKTFFIIRRRYVTLLETMIAISLLAVLLVFVFSFFSELSYLNTLSEKAQKESFQMRYLETRLGFIFERLVNEKEKDRTRTFFFYTQPTQKEFTHSPSLIFTFNNEVKLDPNFSGDVLARLYVDLDHRLCLVIWPLHVEQPEQFLQEEVLFENVADVKYSFYAAPERIRNNKDITSGKKIDPEQKIPEKDKWHDDWAISYNQMPCMIKMIVYVAKNPDILKHNTTELANEDTQKITLTFVLPSSKNPIYYPSG